MKKFCIGLLAACAFTGVASAGEVKVTWQDPDKYTDIRPSSETKEAFQAEVFSALGKVFADMAKKLPDDVKWDVIVTDVDLAGDVRPMMRAGMNDIRIVKEIYWPRMSLTYTMTDGGGKVIAEGKDDIKDMNFMSNSMLPSSSNSFQYEEKMLQDWFKKQQRDKKFPSK